MEFQYTCEQLLLGEWFGDNQALDCDDVECLPPEGCREPQDPILQKGVLPYTTALCESAILGSTLRPDTHGGRPGFDGDVELITTHPVYSVWVMLGQFDPCNLQYGHMHVDPDGDIYPLFCSQPEANVKSARYSRGYFTVQLNEDDPYGRCDEGDIHARFGVEPPPWAEAAFFHNWAPCGVYE